MNLRKIETIFEPKHPINKALEVKSELSIKFPTMQFLAAFLQLHVLQEDFKVILTSVVSSRMDKY